METGRRIIEINGVKMEVDMRTAKKIDTFKVGDPVKVLNLSSNYDGGSIYPGVIVGFAEFESSPAIEVMILKEDYSGVDFSFITIKQTDTPSWEMIAYNEHEQLFTKTNVIDKFDRLIEQKNIEIEELKRKKKYYIDDFSTAFSKIMSK